MSQAARVATGALVEYQCAFPRTISEYSWCGNFYAGKNSDVVKYSASIPMALYEVHESSDVDALGAVANPRADGDRDIICDKIKRRSLHKELTFLDLPLKSLRFYSRVEVIFLLLVSWTILSREMSFPPRNFNVSRIC